MLSRVINYFVLLFIQRHAVTSTRLAPVTSITAESAPMYEEYAPRHAKSVVSIFEIVYSCYTKMLFVRSFHILIARYSL